MEPRQLGRGPARRDCERLHLLRFRNGLWRHAHDYRPVASFRVSGWQALVLIAATILKVFIYDVSELYRAYRILSSSSWARCCLRSLSSTKETSFNCRPRSIPKGTRPRMKCASIAFLFLCSFASPPEPPFPTSPTSGTCRSSSRIARTISWWMKKFGPTPGLISPISAYTMATGCNMHCPRSMEEFPPSSRKQNPQPGKHCRSHRVRHRCRSHYRVRPCVPPARGKRFHSHGVGGWSQRARPRPQH